MGTMNAATFEMVQSIANGTVPAGKALQDKNGKDIPTEYATKKELSEELAGKQPTGDYVTNEDLSAALEDKATHQEVTDAVEPKANKNYVDTELAKKQPTGDYATNAQVDKKISDAIDKIVNGADGAYDTFKEIADYISEDKTGAAAMIQRLASAEAKITALEGKKVVVPTQTVSIAVSSWASKAATVNVAGVTASSEVLVLPADTSAANVLLWGVKATGTGAGTVTFSCTTTPTAALSFKVVVLS